MAPSEIDTELPRAQVKRLAKLALQQQCNSDKDFTVSKDALLALSESTKIFIHYLTATANDICKSSKRQTISAKDVFEALSELDFDELEQPLREAMEVFKKSKTGKSSHKPKAGAARAPSGGGDGAAAAGDADEHFDEGEEDAADGLDEDGGLGDASGDFDEAWGADDEENDRAKRMRLDE